MKKITITKRPEINYGSDFNSDLSLLFRRYNFSGQGAILITGLESFKKTEYYSVLKNILIENNINIVKETQVDQNPILDQIREFKNVAIGAIIICVGGGSIIDFGKAIKLFFNKKAQIFAVYTLPGSASIVTPFAIFDNDEFKIGEHSEEIIPNYVYINEDIILKTPIDLIKRGMFDILTHAIESFISKTSTKESRGYALKALKYLDHFIESDLTDNFLLIQADIFAGLSEKIGSVLFPHAMGHYLTYKYKIPHNLATMYFLEEFIALIQIRGFVIEENILRLIRKFNVIFLRDYKKPLSLTDKDIRESYGLIEKYMPFIFVNNPVALTKNDYLTLYKRHERN